MNLGQLAHTRGAPAPTSANPYSSGGEPGSVAPSGTLVNPVTFHDRGMVDSPSGQAVTTRAYDHPVGHPVNTQDVLGLVGETTGPALPDPAPNTRPARHPAHAWLLRAWSDEWNQIGPGAHGVITPGAATPPGEALPFRHRGNSFRLAPEPWDSPLFEGFHVGSETESS